jgi:PKD repeat protein
VKVPVRSRAAAARSRLAMAFVVVVLLASLGAGGLAASPRSDPTPFRLDSLSASDAPVLSLVPSPSVGNAPLNVNVTASISGGVGPYNLSVCFGTVDHQSPAPNCGVGSPAWTGAAPLVFSHVYLDPGNFSVVAIATDAHGAGVGSTALIVVTDQNSLGANAVEVTGSGRAPLTATFNETVVGGTPPITLQWAFGDGTSGSELPGVPVQHIYETPGVFTPQLTVTDGAGHRTVRTLAPITVTAAPTSSYSLSSAPVLALLAGLLGAVVAAGAGFRVAQTRRWRREGDELVARLQSAPPPPPNRNAP